MADTPTLWKSSTKANTIDDPADIPAPFLPHSTATNDQVRSRVVALAEGGYLVAWEDESSFHAGGLEPFDIAGQMYDALGNKVGSQVGLSTLYQDLSQEFFDIAALPGGGFLSAYQTLDAVGLGDGFNVAVQVTDANGAYVRTDDFRQGAGPQINDWDPSITVHADGSYTIIHDEVTVGSPILVGYHVSATGVKGPKFTVDDTEAATAETVLLSNGNVAVAYTDFATDQIHYKVITPTGTQVASGVATPNSSPGHYAYEVAALTGGGFVIVWTDLTGAPNASEIMAQRFGNDGAAIGSAFNANVTTRAGDQNFEAVAGLADGGFLVAWADQTSGAIQGQRFNAAGVAVGGEVVLDANGTEPYLALLADGRVAVSFTRFDAPGNPNIYTAIWDPRTSPISGTGADDVITSRLDGATITALGGNDTLHGQGGNDVLEGGAGNDILNGGGGTDTAAYTSATTLVRIDLALAGQQNTQGAGLDTLSSIENASGGSAGDQLFGNGDGNTLTGNAGADHIDGRGGNDFLFGGSEGDTLVGGSGDDQMTGGTGNDTYYVDSTLDVMFEGLSEGAADTVIASANIRLDTMTSAVGVEHIVLQGAANLTAVGGAVFNTITGNTGNNYLAGYGGNDTVNGGAGNDRIQGNDGKDTLTGGTGDDQFIYTFIADSGGTQPRRDVITDFGQVALNNDWIDLSLADANGALAGNQAFTWLGTGAFTGAAGELRYFQDVAGNRTIIEGQVRVTPDSPGLEFSLELTGLFTLTAGATNAFDIIL